MDKRESNQVCVEDGFAGKEHDSQPRPVILWESGELASLEAQVNKSDNSAAGYQQELLTTPVAHRKAGEVMRVEIATGVFLKLCWCPPGSFVTCRPASEAECNDNESQHRVRQATGFWLSKNEVTEEQWDAVMEDKPSQVLSAGKDTSVDIISWGSCQEFVRRMNARVPGGGFRLLSEAEWEYVCWAESATAKGNAWGLCDMHATVWEWRRNRHGGYPRSDMWSEYSRYCRRDYRVWFTPHKRQDYMLRIRLARGP